MSNNSKKILFQCDDVGLVDDFKQYCREHKMTMAGMLRKSMYESVAKFKYKKIPKFFTQLNKWSEK